MQWIERDDQLEAEFRFESYASALDFLNKVASLAEEHNHHPLVIWDYSKVIIRLSTHDAGNRVTDLDRRLAKDISALDHFFAR